MLKVRVRCRKCLIFRSWVGFGMGLDQSCSNEKRCSNPSCDSAVMDTKLASPNVHTSQQFFDKVSCMTPRNYFFGVGWGVSGRNFISSVKSYAFVSERGALTQSRYLHTHTRRGRQRYKGSYVYDRDPNTNASRCVTYPARL